MRCRFCAVVFALHVLLVSCFSSIKSDAHQNAKEFQEPLRPQGDREGLLMTPYRPSHLD